MTGFPEARRSAAGHVGTTSSMGPETAAKLLSIIVIFWSRLDIASGSPQLEPMRTMALRYRKVAGIRSGKLY